MKDTDLPPRISKLKHDDDPAVLELRKLLDSVHSRRGFLKGIGMSLGYGALAATLPACSSSSDSPVGSSPDEIPIDDTTPVTPPPAPVVTLPPASAEYNALKRTSFGVHRDSLSTMQSLGIEAYLEYQLDYLSISDGDLESTIQTLFPLTTKTPAELIPGFPDNIASVAQQMIGATQYRQIFSERQLYEVMVEFWSDHFNIHLLNGFGPVLKPEDDRTVIRAHALGNFRELLGASASSPSMLFYLDNFLNVATAPNENYARELMELHTLGVDGGYSEDDVKQVARCFTGWTIRFPGDPGGAPGSFKYDATVHDTNGKVVLGNSIAAGGQQTDGEQVLDILASHPSTARFIATKLCRRFISDAPDASSIDAVANAFTASSGDIKTTLRALFASDAFRTTADLKFTRPSEYLAGAIRVLAPDTGYPTDNGILFFYAQLILGQAPFYWPTPDGYPDTQHYWANTGGLLNRWRLSFLSYAPYIPSIDVFQIDYASLTDNADSIATILDALVDNLLMRPLSAEDRSSMIAWMVTEAGYAEDETLPAGIPATIAPVVMAVLISSAYFQLR
jgi:hypothetical protein